MRRLPGKPADESGFTLVELLAVIGILGVIGFVLTESLIVGFKTTDATTGDISRSVAVQALQSYFTGDAQSAKQVSRVDPGPSCAPTADGVFLHLSWSDQGSSRDVSYALVADGSAVAGQRELVRWSCTAGAAPDKRMLGHFEFDPAGPLPVLALCDGGPCPDVPGAPATVTLKIPTDRPQEATPTTAPLPETPAGVELTVRRRTA